jgi:hypothetical protein
VAKEPSSTPDPKDEQKSQSPEKADTSEAPGAVTPKKTLTPELNSIPTKQPVAAEGGAKEIPVAEQTEMTRDQDPIRETPTSSATETAERLAAGPSNRSGVLVREEIKSLGLIHVPDADFEEDRSYQPTSYDLRLGSEYVMPHKGGQFEISHCDSNGMLTIGPFATAIVSTYESVSLPAYVVGRFNLRLTHALEGLIVQMGTQVEPDYDGPLYALLHNISDQPKTLKFRDYDTRPFTIEFAYTSQPAPPADTRKKKKKSFRDFVPPNYAKGGIDLVLSDLSKAQETIKDVSKEFSARKMLIFTSIFFGLIILTANIFIPFVLSKLTYDKDYFPIVNADAIAAMRNGANHSSDDAIAKRVLQELEAKSASATLVPRERFYAERLVQLKAKRDSMKKDTAHSAELRSIQKEIDEIIELLRK